MIFMSMIICICVLFSGTACKPKELQEVWTDNDEDYTITWFIGSFTLIEKSSIGDYIQWKSSSGRNVRIVEDGDVLTRIEAIFSYKKADAIVCYTFYKHFNYFDIDVRMNNNNFDVTYKLTLGLAEECKLFGESMFGQEELSQSGCELFHIAGSGAKVRKTP